MYNKNDETGLGLQNQLREFYLEFGEIPKKREFCNFYSRCDKSISRRWDTWSEFIEDSLASITVNETYNNKNNVDTIDMTETPIPQPEMDLDEVFDTMRKMQDIDSKANPKETFATLGSSKITEPIAFVFTSDWHLGSKFTDYTQWQADMFYLLGLPPERFRVFLCGDLIDNVFPRFKSAEAVFGTLSPTNQKMMLRELADKISPYLAASCWGNHDNEWDEKQAGCSDVAKLLQKHCHYFFGKGYVNYRVGGEIYKIAMSHNLDGSSWFHNVQGQIREWLNSHYEIVVGAHKHSPGLLRDTQGTDPEGNPRKRYLIQLGTYKNGNDTYSCRYFSRGAIENTTLVVYPDRHKIVEFECVEDAAKWMGITPKKITSFKQVRKG